MTNRIKIKAVKKEGCTWLGIREIAYIWNKKWRNNNNNNKAHKSLEKSGNYKWKTEARDGGTNCKECLRLIDNEVDEEM